MVLKESFRHQNYLAKLLREAQYFLSQDENVMSIKEEHLRSRSNPNAKDETIEVPKESELTAVCVLSMVEDILAEQKKLSYAIAEAKKNAEIDIDAALAMNKKYSSVIFILNTLASKKSKEEVKKGTDYLINAEGNQSAYVYDVKTIKTIDYNRTEVKNLAAKLKKEADEVSAKIDLINVTLEVDYKPVYELDESFEDACLSFMKRN